MNFLAHIYLSENNEEVILGNFIGDFVKGKEFLQYDPAIQRGITLHRQIDDFTDHHPIVTESKKRLRAAHGHYAPVIVDVFYDHFLASRWADYSDVPLDQFTNDFYKLTLQYHSVIPDRARHMLSFMQRDNWLFNYQFIEGIHQALSGMSRRTKFKSGMEYASQELERNYADYLGEFQEFFPDLQTHCQNFLSN